MLSMLIFESAHAEESTWIRVQGGVWQPSDKSISRIKVNLETHMIAQAKLMGRPLNAWSTYRFQYQGQEEKGLKFIYINAFCYFDRNTNLSKTFVFVFDGGSCFFQVKYDPLADKFFDTFINGDA
jgi:hypothetical protein